MKSLAGLCVVALALLAGCAQRTVITRSPAPVVVASDARFARSLGIPPGHLPPPGECRIWYPGTPPGQQPPPGPCGVRVPAGVWFLSRPADRNHVRVSVYDGERPGVVIGIALYEAATGRFVREER